MCVGKSTTHTQGGAVQSKRILIIAAIIAVALAVFATGETQGCMPTDDGTCLTVAPQPNSTTASAALTAPLAVNRALLRTDLTQFVHQSAAVPPSVPALAPSAIGNAETNSLIVPQNEWVYLSAGETVWFRVGENIRRVGIALNFNREPNMTMSVYSPEQADVFNTDPIGKGTRENGADLYYGGTSRGKGSWYVKFKNSNAYSVPYKLTAQATTDSGVTYNPEVTFAFGTGTGVKPVAKPVETKPVTQPNNAPAAAAPAAPQPGSPDPFNAPAPSGTQFHIPPKSTVWYAISDRGRRLTLMMDADPSTGLVMAVYGPDIQDVWHAKPTGQGAPGGGFKYFWTGRSRFKGIWRIRITNPSDFSVPYTLIGANVSDKNGDLCRDCHGIVDDSEFERCEHEGDFCEDLRDQMQN